MSDNLSHIKDDLLVKYLLGECTGEEARQVMEWIGRNASNARYFQQFREVWEESRRLAINSVVDENAAWLKFQDRIRASSQVQLLKPAIRTAWMRIAALFILITGIAILTFILFKESPEQILVASSEKVVTDTLPDGSVITLNKNSSISYPEKFIGGKREVSLQGEAFFEVTPDSDRPFEIRVNDVTVKVIGTSFNIKNEKGRTEVIVATGKVQVTRNSQSVELIPGQKVVTGQGINRMAPETEKEELYQYYQSNEFVCDNTPLWKLVEVLNEAFSSQISIERKELRALLLNTTFSNESLDVILNIIRETFYEYNIQVVRTGDKIILR